jgi:DNA/RNA-binding domain of Phe-tRNA-synthetase-like protein
MFAYADEVIARFPTIRAAVIHATGLSNGPSPPALLEEYSAAQEAASHRLEATAVADHPSIRAWRRAFSQFGAKPTQYRSAPEALLRRLDKHGDIPSINTLVDVGNLVSIRYAMPIAVFDRAHLAGSITVRFAVGDEVFSDLGSSSAVFPEPGEVIFVDEEDVVCARRWCWRQSAESATGPSTAEALVVIEGLHDTADPDIREALSDLIKLLISHQPRARITAYQLSASNPSAIEGEGLDPTIK